MKDTFYQLFVFFKPTLLRHNLHMVKWIHWFNGFWQMINIYLMYPTPQWNCRTFSASPEVLFYSFSVIYYFHVGDFWWFSFGFLVQLLFSQLRVFKPFCIQFCLEDTWVRLLKMSLNNYILLVWQVCGFRISLLFLQQA